MSNAYNHATIIGNLCNEPEFATTQLRRCGEAEEVRADRKASRDRLLVEFGEASVCNGRAIAELEDDEVDSGSFERRDGEAALIIGNVYPFNHRLAPSSPQRKAP